jgi:hypothetical protein
MGRFHKGKIQSGRFFARCRQRRYKLGLQIERAFVEVWIWRRLCLCKRVKIDLERLTTFTLSNQEYGRSWWSPIFVSCSLPALTQTFLCKRKAVWGVCALRYWQSVKGSPFDWLRPFQQGWKHSTKDQFYVEPLRCLSWMAYRLGERQWLCHSRLEELQISQ